MIQIGTIHDGNVLLGLILNGLIKAGGDSAPLTGALQWLFGLEDDYVTVDDQLDLVNPQPRLKDVTCLDYNVGNVYTDFTPVICGSEIDLTFTAFFPSDAISSAAVFYYGNYEGGADNTFILRKDSTSNAITFQSRSDGNIQADYAAELTVWDDNWHTIRLTWESDGTMTWWMDDMSTPVRTKSYAAPAGWPDSQVITLGTTTLHNQKWFNGIHAGFKLGDIIDVPLEEGKDLPFDVSGNDNHATFNSALWVTNSDYVTSAAAGEYIDTGIAINTQFSRIVYEGVFRDTGVNQIIVANGNTLPTTGLVIQTTGTINTYFPTSGDMRCAAGTLVFGQRIRIDVDYVDETIHINGVLQTLQAGSGTLGHSGNVEIFGRNEGGDYTVDADTYLVQLWESGDITRNYVALSSGRFYERITNAIYSNDGAGTLVTTTADPIPSWNGGKGFALTQILSNTDDWTQPPWSGSSTITGAQSCTMNSVGNTILATVNETIIPGDTFRFKGYLWTDVANSGTARITPRIFRSGGGTLEYGHAGNIYLTDQPQWVEFDYEFQHEQSGCRWDVYAAQNTPFPVYASNIELIDMRTRIPALDDGTAAADGSAITNAGGKVHNDFGGTLAQTASFDAFEAVAGAYGDGMTAWYPKTKAELDYAYGENGWYNLWIKVDEDGLITEAKQYPMDQIFTEDEAVTNLEYFGTGGNPWYSEDHLQQDANGYIVYTS